MEPCTLFRTASRLAAGVCLLAILPLAVLAEEGAEAKEAPVIEAGRTVSIEYTLKLADGEVADTNVGGQPLTYQQGQGQLLPALEAELEGLGAGDTKEVELSAERGYGPVRDELFQAIPKEQIPEDARSVGAVLVAQAPGGQQTQVRVAEVKESEVVIDHNHPLAGQELHFDIKVLDVE